MINNLKEFRKKVLGMTQAEAATCLGISAVTWGQWERGDKNPKGTTLQRICKAFDCSAKIQPDGSLEFEAVNSIESSRQAAHSNTELPEGFDEGSAALKAAGL